MALPPTRPRSRVLTASAAKLGEPNSLVAQRMRMPWQERALKYTKIVPELNYASRFYARMLKQLLIYPAKLDDHGQLERTDDALPVRLLNRIQDPAGGRSQILGNYGRLMFATGEGLLFGRDLDTDDEKWSFVWIDEVKVEYNGDETIRQINWQPTSGSAPQIPYTSEQAAVYRMWTPAPDRSGEAESPMQAALDIAEELIQLTLAVMATATSRTVQGVLVIPSELMPPPAEPSGDEDPHNDPLMSDFIQHLVAQKENAGTAEAAAPFFFSGAYEFLDRVRKIDLHDTQNDYAERDLRKEAVERLARGFDMPPEVLLGLADSNHWAARQILDDMWRSHGAPIAEQFCDDLNEAYLRPALRAEGYTDWKQIVIGYDESQIVVKPDRSEDADAALDRIMVGPRGYRRMKNIPEAEAPTPEEEQWLLEIRRSRSQRAADNQSMPAPDAAEGPPPPGPEGDSGRRTRVAAGTVARELGAAEMALSRCRELAGRRLRAQENKCPDCLEGANGKPFPLVAAAMGPQNVANLKLEPRTLVAGGTDALKPVLSDWGYTTSQTGTICELVELFAARTLFETHVSLPKSVESQIAQIKDISDAVGRP